LSLQNKQKNVKNATQLRRAIKRPRDILEESVQFPTWLLAAFLNRSTQTALRCAAALTTTGITPWAMRNSQQSNRSVQLKLSTGGFRAKDASKQTCELVLREPFYIQEMHFADHSSFHRYSSRRPTSTPATRRLCTAASPRHRTACLLPALHSCQHTF